MLTYSQLVFSENHFVVISGKIKKLTFSKCDKYVLYVLQIRSRLRSLFVEIFFFQISFTVAIVDLGNGK
jgi:retron-type reverse transcriptase